MKKRSRTKEDLDLELTEFIEQSVAAARNSSSDDSVGCFSRKEILELARSAELPDETAALHIASCRTCLALFRSFREAAKRG